MTPDANETSRDGNALALARGFEIDTRQEPVIFIRADSAVARSEGFQAMSRVNVRVNGRTIIATLMIVSEQLLAPGNAGLSCAAIRLLQASEGDDLHLSHAQPIMSLAHVRAKIYGQRLAYDPFREIIADVVAGRYMDVHLAAFVTACANGNLALDEITNLTRAMVDSGERLQWSAERVVDKHCVGGLPGNRTTPIIVAIVTANGLVMPKTSSRAITSPAGTADTMETLTRVDLSISAIRRVVEQEGGCIAWGGSVNLSPADDALIRVEKALDLDSPGQLVASVLSKKIAAGSTDVVIDMPVGPTAKVRTPEAAAELSEAIEYVAGQLGLNVRVLISDGRQPVGRGIGPALEAREVLAVLQGAADAPQDLRARSLTLAGVLLEVAGVAVEGDGEALADKTLTSGAAWRKFLAICEAQGGLREPPRAAFHYDVFAERDGMVTGIDNRTLARIAKLAGAPADKAAGLEINVKLGAVVSKGDILMTIHAESPGELEYALQFERGQPGAVVLGPPE